MFGAIEAGGTKFVCAVGHDLADLNVTQLPTSSPQYQDQRLAGFPLRFKNFPSTAAQLKHW